MIRRLTAGLIVGLGALCAGPAVVSAHPYFVQSAPAPGFVAQKSPGSVRVVLSEPMVARGSKVEVSTLSGRRVPFTQAVAAGGGRTLSADPRRRLRPGVYVVRWTALGTDGHAVTGDFRFGVAGKGGAAPPGAEKLNATAGGRGTEDPAAEGAFGVVARWLGIVAASVLLAGWLLSWRLRRRDEEDDGGDALRPLQPMLLLLAGIAASQGIVAGALAGGGESFDLGLLTGSPTGRAELARGAVVALGAVALVVVGTRRERVRDAVYGVAGAALLVTYALSGHVLSEPTLLGVTEQLAHVLAAGLWMGGVLAVALVVRRGGVATARAARAFAPLAAGGLAVAVVTGVLSAVREVNHWYFLRWSDYGRLVIAKSVLVALVVAIAGFVAWRARRGDGTGLRLVRVEALGLLATVVVAATLAGLAQGRGQPLPAQRGSLYAGAALGNAVLTDGSGKVALAPARAGANRIAFSLPAGSSPRTASVRITCACSKRTVRATLRRAPGTDTWSASVRLPADGEWYAYPSADHKRRSEPTRLTVGVPKAPGSKPLSVLTVADLSGPGAERCRDHVQGFQIGVAAVNASGGLDGGRKLAPDVLDSRGTPAGAARVARAALRNGRPIALAGVCGTGGEAAVRIARAAGVPALVGDPAVAPVSGPGTFRLAADPYAEGLAYGQALRSEAAQSLPSSSRVVRVVASRDARGRRLLAGLRDGSQSSGTRIQTLAPGALARSSRAELVRLMDRRSTLELIVDGPPGTSDMDALTRLARKAEDVPENPPPVVLSGRLLTERTIVESGALGRLGALRGTTEVSPKSTDAILFARAVPTLFPGDRPSLDGLRGYATGQALRDAVRNGTDADEVIARLRSPDVFSNALLAPWSRSQTGVGSPSVVPLVAQFVAPTLVPSSLGGERYEGTFFPDGAWTQTSAQALGVRPGGRAPRL